MGQAGVDPPFLRNLLLFGRALRSAGIEVSLEQILSFARALDWLDIGSREQVFHAARSLLVSRREDLRLFALVFNRFWLGIAEPRAAQRLPLAPRRDLLKGRRFQVSYLASAARPEDPAVDVADRAATYSAEEILRRRDFARMSPAELAEVRRLIEQTRWRMSERRTRRRIAARRGSRIHLRRMLRDAAKLGGAAPRLRHLSRKVKQRPIVLLADISGSMDKYSRLILQLFYSATHSLRDVECFVFGTRLTRITGQLRLRNIDRALAEAASEIVDWSGGTRIGESLAEFNRRWARRVLRRGAVVVIVSDGWERGDAARLGREMRHLHHRCHRLIWLNPHLGQTGYEPLVEGMAAALPWVDDFLPIHNLRSLRELSARLGRLPARRTGMPPVWRRRAADNAPRAGTLC
jgi:uncharacterized protein with von Willebrand factor type A (vWA) domain